MTDVATLKTQLHAQIDAVGAAQHAAVDARKALEHAAVDQSPLVAQEHAKVEAKAQTSHVAIDAAVKADHAAVDDRKDEAPPAAAEPSTEPSHEDSGVATAGSLPTPGRALPRPPASASAVTSVKIHADGSATVVAKANDGSPEPMISKVPASAVIKPVTVPLETHRQVVAAAVANALETAPKPTTVRDLVIGAAVALALAAGWFFFLHGGRL